jgi:SAM-dependent methyltransferase
MPVPPASSSDSRDDWDRHWTEYADSAEQNPAQKWRRELIVDRLDLKPGAKLIDVGSGQGDLARDILALCPNIEMHGLELSPSGVDHARRKVAGATFHQVDLLSSDSRLRELEGWADRVICAEVLEHLDDPSKLLVNALRHAAPGARVVVTVPAGPRTAFDIHIGHRRHYDQRSLRELLERSGVQVVSVDAAGFPFFNLYRLIVLLRGKRLIGDVREDNAGVDSLPAKVLLRTFGLLFRANWRHGARGWQMVAVGTVQGTPTAQ